MELHTHLSAIFSVFPMGTNAKSQRPIKQQEKQIFSDLHMCLAMQIFLMKVVRFYPRLCCIIVILFLVRQLMSIYVDSIVILIIIWVNLPLLQPRLLSSLMWYWWPWKYIEKNIVKLFMKKLIKLNHIKPTDAAFAYTSPVRHYTLPYDIPLWPFIR